MAESLIFKINKEYFTEKSLKKLSDKMKKKGKDRHILVKSLGWDGVSLRETAKLKSVDYLDDIFE